MHFFLCGCTYMFSNSIHECLCLCIYVGKLKTLLSSLIVELFEGVEQTQCSDTPIHHSEAQSSLKQPTRPPLLLYTKASLPCTTNRVKKWFPHTLIKFNSNNTETHKQDFVLKLTFKSTRNWIPAYSFGIWKISCSVILWRCISINIPLFLLRLWLLLLTWLGS